MPADASLQLWLQFNFKQSSIDDTISLPSQIINQLSWMSHSQHLRRVSREYVIDLYLRPPVTKYRLMDYMHIERIVTSANRCAGQLLCLCVQHAAGGAC